MIHIIYHKNCFDGFTAAWVANKFFAAEEKIFHSANHGDEPPEVNKDDKVYILDFSYKLDKLRELEQKAGKGNVIVLDHHKTAMNDLSSFSNAVFDMGRSGCSITWDYFFPDKAKPEFIRYVEDRDLWNHSLPYTKEVCSYIYSFPFSFEQWDEFFLAWDINWAVATGSHLLRQYKELVGYVLSCPIKVGEVPYFNTNGDFGSDVCNKACTEMKVPFSLYFYYEQERTKFGIRGDGSIDVSAIAKAFGGGGHFSAAGFDLPGHVTPEQLGLRSFQPFQQTLRCDWVSPPGETIADIMDERGMYISGLSNLLGISRTEIHSLLAGTMPLTPDIAQLLTEKLGGSILSWLERERHYRLQKQVTI